MTLTRVLRVPTGEGAPMIEYPCDPTFELPRLDPWAAVTLFSLTKWEFYRHCAFGAL